MGRKTFFVRILFLILTIGPMVFSPLDTWGASGSNEKGKPKKIKKSIRYEWSLASYSSYQFAILNQSTQSLNPNNQILQAPNQTLLFELRPELKMQLNPWLEFNAKGNQSFLSKKILTESPKTESSTSKGFTDLYELFYEIHPSSSLTLRLGLLTYEWGPAELASPSNGLFHFTKEQTLPFFQRKGYVLSQLTYNLSDQTNVQWLQEMGSNRSPSWIEDDDTSNRVLFKLEHQFENSFNYMGITGGRAERDRLFYGLYMNYVPVEGYSIYFDGRITKGSLGYHPRQIFPNQYELAFREDPNTNYGYWIWGGRFESDFDLRLEWLHFDEGYDRAEYDLWFKSLGLTQLRAKENWLRTARNGLEFNTQDYQFFSLRIPDILWKKQMAFALRYIFSSTTNSGLLLATLDSPLGDSATLSATYLPASGDSDSEFLMQESERLVLMLQWILK